MRLDSSINLREWVPSAADGPFAALLGCLPWDVTSKSEAIVRNALGVLAGYSVQDGVAIHRTATIEHGAVIKAPAIVGPRCLVAASAYLRGGVFLDEACIVGPCCELKSTFMLRESKVAHQSFVGDSVIGGGANIEAGAIIAHFRNERADKTIRIVLDGEIIETGVEKFGALIGDGARIGADAVVAPGALLRPGALVPRLSLVDQAAPPR
ncbi:MAG: transferase [Parvularculaceae bacterium]|nr:transferase [Parvularculaceae bacterium]